MLEHALDDLEAMPPSSVEYRVKALKEITDVIYRLTAVRKTLAALRASFEYNTAALKQLNDTLRTLNTQILGLGGELGGAGFPGFGAGCGAPLWRIVPPYVATQGTVLGRDGRDRLAEDHARARRLAEALAEFAPAAIDLGQVETNMVFVHTEAVGIEPLDAIDRLAALGVGAVPVPGAVRMVTHVDVDDDGIGLAIDAWRAVVEGAKELP
jgi:hypothetical protein